MARRDQGEDEPVPLSAHLVELAAASDPILGSGEVSPQAADLLGYLIRVGGRETGRRAPGVLARVADVNRRASWCRRTVLGACRRNTMLPGTAHTARRLARLPCLCFRVAAAGQSGRIVPIG